MYSCRFAQIIPLHFCHWYIEQALRLTNGNLSQAAELLGIPRQTLKYKVQKLEIEL